MNQLELIKKLNSLLLNDMPQYYDESKKFSEDIKSQRRLLRNLMNLRPPQPLTREYIELQDKLLSFECTEKGIIDISTLESCKDKRFILWKGDSTRLNADAIVNAANSNLLGCFYPSHKCIDNAIHSSAGLQLRDECNRLMLEQGYKEPIGKAKITSAYNLPSKYIIHTVGPIIQGELTQSDCKLLEGCYNSCLKLAVIHKLESIAFCCISTGEFHFPPQVAAEIAVNAVKKFIETNDCNCIQKVIFNVFKESDYNIYFRLLN